MLAGKFTVFKSKENSQYYFNLKTSAGSIVLRSEGYLQEQGCLNGVESVQDNASNMDRYEKRVASDKRLYFVLKAANGQVIGLSQMYDSTESGARDLGILQVASAADGAQIEIEE